METFDYRWVADLGLLARYRSQRGEAKSAAHEMGIRANTYRKRASRARSRVREATRVTPIVRLDEAGGGPIGAGVQPAEAIHQLRDMWRDARVAPALMDFITHGAREAPDIHRIAVENMLAVRNTLPQPLREDEVRRLELAVNKETDAGTAGLLSRTLFLRDPVQPRADRRICDFVTSLPQRIAGQQRLYQTPRDVPPIRFGVPARAHRGVDRGRVQLLELFAQTNVDCTAPTAGLQSAVASVAAISILDSEHAVDLVEQCLAAIQARVATMRQRTGESYPSDRGAIYPLIALLEQLRFLEAKGDEVTIRRIKDRLGEDEIEGLWQYVTICLRSHAFIDVGLDASRLLLRLGVGSL